MLSNLENADFSESQSQIVQNLTKIDALTNESVISTDNINQLRQIYTDTLQWIDLNFSNLETDISYQLLEFLSHYYQVF